MNMKQTVELFCGTKSFSKVATARGYKTFTVDNDSQFNANLTTDILKLKPSDLPQKPFILWASPPCTGFSVAAFSTHWTGGKGAYIPATETAKTGILLLRKTLKLIRELKPKYWFIENPMGMMRKMPELVKTPNHQLVTYCQYGDTRMKPTDIWTNLDSWVGKRCKNGAPCHERAPRGAKTGTQGLKNAKLRGVIPPGLFEEIFDVIEK